MKTSLYNIMRNLDRLYDIINEFKEVSYNNDSISNEEVHNYVLKLIDIQTALEADVENASFNVIKLEGIIND